MGLLSLKYRRPSYVEKGQSSSGPAGSISCENKTGVSVRSGRSGASSGIPEALAFDKLMNGGTCPPCTVPDFMNYLIYIEHAAENLQFFLWYRDYVRRFHDAVTPDIALAPEWTKTMEAEALMRIQKDASEKTRKQFVAATAIFKGTDFEKAAAVSMIENKDPFSTPPRTPGSGDAPSIFSGSRSNLQAQDAFAAAGAKQPFTIQPFREEVKRVIATYIVENAPRQLNLSAREQKAVVQALSYTTHPSAFRSLAHVVECTLRRQAFPNFIRWTICNGNPARVTFAVGLGVGSILLSTLGAIILALSQAGHGWRALFALGWIFGIATLITALKGMCVVLHGMHHRHVRPWELFADAGGDEIREKRSFDSFGSTNSYEEEPWIVKYDRRNYVRKVFDREVWIQEPALRQIQDTIFVQSMLMATLGAGVLTAIFVAVPAGGFY